MTEMKKVSAYDESTETMFKHADPLSACKISIPEKFTFDYMQRE